MRFRILGVALFAVFAVGMGLSSVAMAEDYGTVCGLTPSDNQGLFIKRSATGVCEEELAEDNNEFEQVLLLLAEWLVGGKEITAIQMLKDREHCYWKILKQLSVPRTYYVVA